MRGRAARVQPTRSAPKPSRGLPARLPPNILPRRRPMNAFTSSDDHQPVLWFRGHAVFAAHLVVLAYVLSMLATTLLLAANSGRLLAWLTFSSSAVLGGQVWRLVSYGLVNAPSLPFVMDMFIIGWFGREVERSLGRRQFLQIVASLYLLPPLLFTSVGHWLPSAFGGERGALALFVAFAALYPGVAVLFNILAQWLALILVSLYSLIALAYRDWVGLLTLWSTCGFAFGYVRHEQGRIVLPDIRFWRRKPNLRLLPDPEPGSERRATGRAQDAVDEVDALLDKIARSGLASLTPKERARLDAARADLLKRKDSSRD